MFPNKFEFMYLNFIRFLLKLLGILINFCIKIYEQFRIHNCSVRCILALTWLASFTFEYYADIYIQIWSLNPKLNNLLQIIENLGFTSWKNDLLLQIVRRGST